MLVEKFLTDLPEPPAFRTFRYFDWNPVSGTKKMRLISDPNRGMRVVHARLIKHLRALPVFLPHATGARKRNSPRRNAERHTQSRYFYLLDIANAFPSVELERLLEALAAVNPQVAAERDAFRAFLAAYCFAPEGGLRVGAPASPDLFNLYAGMLLDRTLGAWCKTHRFTYTRYLDDLTISSRRRLITQAQRGAVHALVEEAGFRVNDRKARFADLRKTTIVVNGVGLAERGRLFLPRPYLRKVCGLLHRALTKDDVPAPFVYGVMGVFRDASPAWHGRNKTETKAWRLYLQFHKRERARRELPHAAKGV